MSYPKAMLSQLTDLDDSELDEQAGVFSFTKKSAPPSPKVFFNPTSVFLDVPDYRETVSHSKRFTLQNPPPNSTASGNNLAAQNVSFLGVPDHEGKYEEAGQTAEGKVNKLLKVQRAPSRNSERSMSVETSKHKKDSNPQSRRHNRFRTNQTESQDKIDRNFGGSSSASAFAASLASKVIHRHESDSGSNGDSDEHEEYIYKLGPRRETSRQSPVFKSKSIYPNEPELSSSKVLTEDTDTEGTYLPNVQGMRANTSFRQKGKHPEFSLSGAARSAADLDLSFPKPHRKSRLKFSSESRESRIPIAHDKNSSQYHRQTSSFDPDRNRHPPTFRKAYIEDWDSQDENLPLVWNMRRGMRECPRTRRSSLSEVSLIPFLCILTIISLSLALFSVSNIALVDVSVVSFGNVLAAEKELSFDLNIRASNWNIWDVTIQEVNLAVYATAVPTPPGNLSLTSSGLTAEAPTPTTAEFLGNVTLLQEPLVFSSGGIWQGRGSPSTATSLARLANPGLSDPTKGKSSNWPEIMKGAYILTVRGSLPHRLLFQKKVARICASQKIEEPASNLPPSQATPCGDDSSNESK
ncbi:Vacuolar inheritance and morphology protein [Entomophthora muscae]|uniref:Vacuolar inheritance and morphology protein n=1 Tax=Entomophthora muscae TaxID=34485 RepID=A0ACC2RUV1_9FUNG|nr:Vacuolar inheritance and morphology protein [Entomophthora muscae]